MKRAALTTGWSRGYGWLPKVAAVAAVAAAFVLVTAQPGGERASMTPGATTSNGTMATDQPDVLGVQLERPSPVPAISTAPSSPAGADEVALPGGGDAVSRSVDGKAVMGLTLLALGLAGIWLVSASSPNRRRAIKAS